MKNLKDDGTSPSDIHDLLAFVKNDLHQKQELFIATKTLNDAIENTPRPGDTSPEAQEARERLERAIKQVENLNTLVNSTPPASPS